MHDKARFYIPAKDKITDYIISKVLYKNQCVGFVYILPVQNEIVHPQQFYSINMYFFLPVFTKFFIRSILVLLKSQLYMVKAS